MTILPRELYPLHPYQLLAIEWMKFRKEGYLNIDMGLGKTRIVLDYIRLIHKAESSGAVLIVAPMRVATSTWPAQIREWTPELSYTVLHGRDKEENFKLKRDLYIINYEGLKWLDEMVTKYGRSKFFHGVLVLDEATMVKSSSSGRFKYLKSLRSSFDKAFALSATPAPNGYQDLWSQYFLLDYGKTLGPQYTRFFNRYFQTTESRRVVPVSTERLKEIPKLCAKSTFRLSADDYLKLPEFTNNDLYVDLPPKLLAQYKELEKDFLLKLSEEMSVTAMNAAVLSMKLRQFCQGGIYSAGEENSRELVDIHRLKVDMLEQIIQELQGAPTLVAIQFRYEVDFIRERFPNAPAIYGGISAKESDRLINLWNAGKLPMLICHPASLSHGVNLQAGGHYITWLALTWNFEQYTQFNGRLRRQGQKNRVVLNRVLVRGSIEEKMAKRLSQKETTQQELLDVLRDMTNEVLAQS